MSWCVSIDQAGSYFLRILSFYIVFLFPSDTCMLSESLNSVRPHPKQMSSFSKAQRARKLKLIAMKWARLLGSSFVFLSPARGFLSRARGAARRNLLSPRSAVCWTLVVTCQYGLGKRGGQLTTNTTAAKKTRAPRKSSQSPFSSWKLTNSTKTRMCSV